MSQTATIANITSANATLVLIVEDLYPNGVVLQNFATDQSLSQDEVAFAETRMGVDGNLAAGWVPSEKNVTLMLEASSPSYEALAFVFRSMEANRRTYTCSLVATVPALSREFTYSQGVLKSGNVLPAMKKVLDPTTWKFTFAKLTSVEV